MVADVTATTGSASPGAILKATLEVMEGVAPGPAALATVVQRTGSAPQVVGARLLLRHDGTSLGTVGGGAIEALVLDGCRQVLRTGVARTISAHLVRDLGMCCGGTMEVFVEYVQARSRLFIIGAGHVAQALAPLACTLDLDVHVLDDRDDQLEHPAFDGCTRHDCDADELLGALGEARPDDHLLIVTRDHARDERALADLLERPYAYLGMIGSRRKVHTVLARVLRRYDERGRSRPDLARLRAPVGLALGGRTPAEIAVSIAAELVAARHGGAGSPMSIVTEAAGKPRDVPEVG